MIAQLNNTKGSLLYVSFVAIIAAVGGFLFGYDTAVISGAVPFIEEYFSLTAGQLGFAVSSVVLGCIFGASIAGSLADKYGRKKIMITAAVLFLVSAILTSLPKSLWLFNLARFIGGVAVGLSSPVSPMYIAEIAPAKIRGALVTLNQLAITFGIVAAYLADLWIVSLGDEQWQVDYAWRWMFASECFPAVLLLVGLFFIPESPRWLLKKGWIDKAREILTKVGGRSHAEREIEDVEQALNEETGSIKQLFMPGFRFALFIGVMIMIFSQITGMNAIYMYTPKLLLAVGFKSKSSALLAMVIVGAVNFVTTIIAVCVIDKLGRRLLMLMAPLGMGICMLTIALGYGSEWLSPGIILAAILIFVFFFAIGVGPGAWLVTSEIFPTKVRGRAMSICTFSLWASSFVANSVFPKFLEWSQLGTFGLFTLACFAMVIFVFTCVPETKGKTLEQIEEYWRTGRNERKHMG
ncbi:MAG: sugar porter family MFS transporter [Sedimentisphaerales bacterium]|nr:sugar porter family MFS transporter [Sedimentisphaerales bacterium]